MYLILRCVCILYILPIGYVLIQLTVEGRYFRSDSLWQMNFFATGVLTVVCLAVEYVWAILIVRDIARYIVQGIKWREYKLGSIPEEDEAVKREFLLVKKEIGVRRNICLYRNAKFKSPMITGVFRCMIILPPGEYTREQLRVMFFHELIHYKSRDLWYKACGIYIGALHGWNPFSKKLLKLLGEWSEYDCDRKSVAAMHGEMSAGCYFKTIMATMSCTPETHGKDYIFSMLYENQASLERRIDYMKKYTKIKRAGKFVSTALIAVFVLTSVTTAYAAGSGVANVQDFIYREAEQTSSVNDVVIEEGMIFIPAGTDNSYDELVYANPEAETIMPVLNENEVVSFQWEVPVDIRYVSGLISLDKGQKVSVSCTSIPTSSTYWIGIMNSGGDVWYYEGKAALAYNFSIEKDGRYRVLVQNRSTVEITATGNYCYYTP